MGILERRSATPKQLAQELGVSVENTSYHVRALRNFGFIELEQERIVRGAVEHLYKASSRPKITAKAWRALPEVVKEAIDAATIGQIGDVVNLAAAQGKLGRPESHISRRPVLLDEEGFAEASRILSDALDRISAVEKQAKKRARSHDDEVRAVVIAMLFDAPDPVVPTSVPAAAPKRRRNASQAPRP
jgi:hypothetical protein